MCLYLSSKTGRSPPLWQGRLFLFLCLRIVIEVPCAYHAISASGVPVANLAKKISSSMSWVQGYIQNIAVMVDREAIDTKSMATWPAG